jgi:hypothetical protein
MSSTALYVLWKGIRARCNNPNHHKYPRYGGKGIKLCKRWDNFANFFKDMGEKPEGMSIDRKDGTKGYSKKNCRWATAKEQSCNQPRVKMYTFKDVTDTAPGWSKRLGLSTHTVLHRLKRGWPIERALKEYQGG